MSDEKGKTVPKRKPKERGPIRVSDATHQWLKNEANRIYNETGRTPSFAELIDTLVGKVAKRGPQLAAASNERGK